MFSSEHISFLLPRTLFSAIVNAFMTTAMGSSLTPRKTRKLSTISSHSQPIRRPLTPINTHVQQSSSCSSPSSSCTPSTACSLSSQKLSLLRRVHDRTYEHDQASSTSEGSDEVKTPIINVISPISPLYSSPSCSPVQYRKQENPTLATTTDDETSTCGGSPPVSPSPSPYNSCFELPTHDQGCGPFLFMRPICKGSYGSAYVVQDLSTSRVLCAKVFRKTSLLQQRHRFIGAVAELRAYQRISESDERMRKWVMDAHGVLQDDLFVLVAMDLMDCDLFTKLQKPVSKSLLRRWIAQTALGIDALHRMGIIHRDIKPENVFIIPGTQNVRIGDFTNAWLNTLEDNSLSGSSAEPLEWWKVYTRECIGTREYSAPELRKEQWYGVSVDWWGLGCLVYDLLLGDILFPNDETFGLYLKTQSGKVKMDPREYFGLRSNQRLTLQERSLLSGLLDPSPHRRFRLEDLESHPFFVEFGCSVFKGLHEMSLEATSRRIRKVSLDLNISPEFENEPLCHARPEPYRPEPLDSLEELNEESPFDIFAWVNPRGILANNIC